MIVKIIKNLYFDNINQDESNILYVNVQQSINSLIVRCRE
jgi:hypothetical protein